MQREIESAKTKNGFVYTNLADNTVEILKYTGTESNVTIPDKIDNKVVKTLGAESFTENETVVGVTIPEMGIRDSCKKSGLLAGEQCQETGIGYYKEGTFSKLCEECR